MENNFYLNVEVEYETTIKNHRGKFAYHSSIYDKYFKLEDVETLIREIKRDVNADGYEVTLSIDSLDWYGNSAIGICRVYNSFGKLNYVSWDECHPHMGGYLENREIDKKEIKSLVNDAINRFRSYVNTKLTNGKEEK